MAIRSVKWAVDLAPSPTGRRRGVVRLFTRDVHGMLPSRTAFEPLADVYETEDAVVVRLEISGLKANSSDILVEIQDDLMTVSGERLDPADGAREYEQMEIRTGRFEKTVRVPCMVSETEAVARYDDGFLVISLPKRKPVRSAVRLVRID